MSAGRVVERKRVCPAEPFWGLFELVMDGWMVVAQDGDGWLVERFQTPTLAPVPQRARRTSSAPPSALSSRSRR